MHAPASPDRAHPNGHVHSPTPPPDGGRDVHGRFAAGNRGGPGNPFARQVAALRSALLARVTPQDVGDVAEALLRQAREGNVAAAKLLLSYTLGKPGPAADPDTLDLHEWELYRRAPDPAPELLTVTNRLPLPLALTVMRQAVPDMVEAHGGMLLDGLERMAAADRTRAEARARREQKKARRAAPPPGEPRQPAAGSPPGPLPPDVAKALEVLADDPEALALFLPPPGPAGGPATPCQPVPPPSTNGTSRRGRPGGPQG
jgi:hypothetical protein